MMKTGILKLGFSGALVLCGGFLGVSAEANNATNVHELTTAGRRLSAQQAAELETQLEKNPEDLATITRLLGYYAPQQFKSAAIQAKREKYILWLIRNHPDAAVLGQPDGQLAPPFENINAAAELWREQVEKNPENVKILANAARSLTLSNRETSLRCWEKLCLLEPENAQWHYSLAHAYQLKTISNLVPADALALLHKSYAEYEIACQKATPQMRVHWLQDFAKAAIRINKVNEADKLADEMLVLAQQEKQNGNLIYFGYMVKGLAALRKDDVALAENCLLKSADTIGSPVLNSFGPNMMLADELLKNERDAVVLKFLAECSKFWTNKKTIEQWIAAIKDGKRPAFGGNLFY